MAQNITLLGASYTAVPAVTLPKTGGGTAKFSDASVTTAVASDVAEGKIFLLADGTQATGTGEGGGSSVTWETLYEGNATIVSDNPNYVSITNFSETIGEGETWRITWNGTPYTCTAVYSSQISGCYIGNARIVASSFTDTGEPFWAYKRTATQLAFSTNQSAGTIALVIERQTTSSGGSSKNVQTAQTTDRRSNTSLGSIVSLTCQTAGTYDVYWTCARSNTSQTWGSQLYINGVAYGTENTAWSNNVQNNHLTGVVLATNDTVAVYGRSRSGYYIHAPQLTIVQTA